ncbi:hypothetical protein C7W93_06840 [Glaciimonas sp. PCH181]|nr:hypothetical protein C7W93_06840 [Glaciimonas sp. PCH181]
MQRIGLIPLCTNEFMALHDMSLIRAKSIVNSASSLLASDLFGPLNEKPTRHGPLFVVIAYREFFA